MTESNAVIGIINRHKKLLIAIYLLATFHLVGIFGIVNESTRSLFIQLTPGSLILSALIVGWFHREWNKQFAIFLGICYVAGLSIEIIGVNTGFPFGEYQYGSGLGPKIFETPLLIGLNWVLLIYCTGATVEKITSSLWLKILLGALLMLFIDILMEPVAPVLDLWSFKEGYAPFSNYAGWVISSIGLHSLYRIFGFAQTNNIAIIYFGTIILFFVTLNLCLIERI